MRLNALLIAAGAVALLSAAAPAFAEDAAPQPAPAAAAAPPAATAPAAPSAAPAAPAVVPDAIKAWAKFCDAQDDGHQVCIVRKLTFNGTNIEASIVLRLDSKKGTPALAIAAVPVGVALKPGLSWRVDNNKAQVLPYWRCTPQACESEQLASADFLNRLRKGKTLTLTAKNVDGKDVSVDIPLAGFSAAFDLKDAPTYVEYSKQMAAAQAAAQAAAK
jgi:invasion protein IalB